MEINCSLPLDLVQDILSRLGVGDLLRFRCVSKDWCTVIDNPSFIKKHYQVQYSICKEDDDNMRHFVYDPGWYVRDKFHLLSIIKGDVLTFDLTDDLERDSKDGFNYDVEHIHIDCNGCVNGTIFLECIYKNLGFVLGLWNPATRDFTTVECPNVPWATRATLSFVGFGFDPISNDFKILCSYGIESGYLKVSVCYEIYSLRTKSWKSLRETPGGRPIPPRTDAYLNGMFYWTLGPDEETCPNLMILSFNFSSEVFKLCDPPQDAVSLASGSSGIYPYQKMMALYKDNVALFISHEVLKGAALYSVDIWIVTRFDGFGVPLSWQHLFTVGPTPAKLGLTVRTTRINGDLLLDYHVPTEIGSTCPSDEDVETYLYNQLTGEFNKFEITFSAIYRYVESLFPLSRRLRQIQT